MVSDALTVGYQQAIVDVGSDMTVENTNFDPAILTRHGLFSTPERLTFPNLKQLDLDALIGRARSASYVPRSGAAGERLVHLLRDLHRQHADANGLVTFVYETEVFRSHKL